MALLVFIFSVLLNAANAVPSSLVDCLVAVDSSRQSVYFSGDGFVSQLII